MFTIKVHIPGEGYEVISTKGEVSIHAPGESEFEAIYAPCREYEDHVKDPRAILRFEQEDSLSARMIYDDDRAWIMNANGKTVASV